MRRQIPDDQKFPTVNQGSPNSRVIGRRLDWNRALFSVLTNRGDSQ
jgi:hypothetical protein